MFDLVEERTLSKSHTPVYNRENTHTSLKLQREGNVEQKLTVKLDATQLARQK